jgi:hypothetical protein
MMTSDDLLSNYLTPLFNKLKDKIENTVVKNKFKIVTRIILDSFIKPADHWCYVCSTYATSRNVAGSIPDEVI